VPDTLLRLRVSTITNKLDTSDGVLNALYIESEVILIYYTTLVDILDDFKTRLKDAYVTYNE